jgi:hypothetical protein
MLPLASDPFVATMVASVIMAVPLSICELPFITLMLTIEFVANSLPVGSPLVTRWFTSMVHDVRPGVNVRAVPLLAPAVSITSPWVWMEHDLAAAIIAPLPLYIFRLRPCIILIFVCYVNVELLCIVIW